MIEPTNSAPEPVLPCPKCGCNRFKVLSVIGGLEPIDYICYDCGKSLWPGKEPERPGGLVYDWFITASGKQFSPWRPRAEDICIEDIASALSKICRFGGHTREFYSVAQHSCLVAGQVQSLKALLHDATEAYCGDMIAPIKRQMPGYEKLESGIWLAVCERFNLDPAKDPAIKRADMVALVTERRDLIPHTHWNIKPEETGYEPLSCEINPLAPDQARDYFLALYNLLNY